MLYDSLKSSNDILLVTVISGDTKSSLDNPQWCCSQDCYVHNVRFTYKYCIHPTIVNLAYKIRMFATFGRTVFKVYLNRGEHSVTALFIEHVREIFANLEPESFILY